MNKMGKFINSFFKNKKPEEKLKNEVFDASNPQNTDETLLRASQSVLLLIKKIEDLLTELKQTNFENMSKDEKERLNHDILGKIQVISKFIDTLHSLGLHLVNNPKYKNTHVGSFLNLNFLSILNRIRAKELIINKRISENHGS